MRAPYDAARALYPLLPQWYELIEDGITPEFRGLNAGGLPVFGVPLHYTLMADEGAHEAGHAYQKLLERADPTYDYLTAYWLFRGFTGTWQQALAGSRAIANRPAASQDEQRRNANESWLYDPRESWAEAFARSVVPTHTEKTMNFGKDMNPLLLRAFFLSLDGTKPAIVPTVSPAIENTQPTVIDVRDELPRTDWEIGRFGPKNSRTYHWNGPALPADVAPLDLILGDAHYHVSKDWSPEPGIQGGDGIMYHRLIAPNGDLYVTRDPDAVLWACGSVVGNAQSEHVQVMLGVGQSPTPAQYRTMTWLEEHEPLGETFPHRIWSNTTCPGDEIAAWVERRAWNSEEDDMDRPTFDAWFKDNYEKYGVAALFDKMKKIDETLAAANTADDARDAAQQATLDKKADKGHAHTATVVVS